MQTVHMEKRGDYYFSWHQDARNITAALGDVAFFQMAGADTVGIPAPDLADTINDLHRKGIAVKISEALEE